MIQQKILVIILFIVICTYMVDSCRPDHINIPIYIFLFFFSLWGGTKRIDTDIHRSLETFCITKVLWV